MVKQLSEREKSKLWLMITIFELFLLIGFVVTQAEAAIDVEKIAGGKVGYKDGPAQEAMFYQPQLVEWDQQGEGVYVVDGVSIRYLHDSQVETITGLWGIEDQLEPYGLNGEARIWSFRAGELQWYGNKLYLSGLMFKKDVKALPDLTPASSGWTREGFTYNVFFEIDPGSRSIELLRADVAYCNITPRTGNYISGLWNSRPDLTWENGKALYVYYFFCVIPRIQPVEDGFITLKTEDRGTDINAESHWLVKWYPDGREEKLFNLSKLPHRYYEWDPVPNSKGTPADGLINTVVLPISDSLYELTDGRNSETLDLEQGLIDNSKSVVNVLMDETSLNLWKGRKIGDDWYFMDHKGLWSIKDGIALRLVKKEDLNFSGNVLGYDINDQNEVVIGVASTGAIGKFTIKEELGDGLIYLNGKPVLSGKGNLEPCYINTTFKKGDAFITPEAVEAVFNLNVEPLYYPDHGFMIYHPSGRQAKLQSYQYRIRLSELIETYNSISVMKIEGKWDYKNLYLKTKGTVDSNNNGNAPGVIYGLPAYE